MAFMLYLGFLGEIQQMHINQWATDRSWKVTQNTTYSVKNIKDNPIIHFSHLVS